MIISGNCVGYTHAYDVVQITKMAAAAGRSVILNIERALQLVMRWSTYNQI